MKTVVTLASFGLIFWGSWTVRPKNELKQVEWILGTWERHTSRGIIYEHWKKANNYEFSGKSYMIRQGDTTICETIQLISGDAGMYYIPTVRNQNNAMPVKFKVQEISDSAFTFANKMHDFPQYISYRKIGRDSLLAEISGKLKGEERRRQFFMRKVK